MFGPLLDRGLSVAGDTRQLSFRSWGCQPYAQLPTWAAIYLLLLTPRSISVWHGWNYKELDSCRHRNNARSRKVVEQSESGKNTLTSATKFLFFVAYFTRSLKTNRNKKYKRQNLIPSFKMDCNHINTFTAIVDLSRFNNSCLKSRQRRP